MRLKLIHYSFKQWLKIGFAILCILVTFGLYLMSQLAAPAGRGVDLVSIEISSGDTVEVVSKNLKKANLIRSSFWFETWVAASNNEKRIMAGNYKLPQNISILNLTRMITGGVDASADVKLTIIEGWNISDIGSYLNRLGLVTRDDFITSATDSDSVSKISELVNSDILASKPDEHGLEGYLFPDTYRVYESATSIDIIIKAIDNLNKKFTDEWRNNLKNKGYSIHQALTLASIIELEVTDDNDRAMVADIFYRRLKVGMGLQADSTVNYVTGKNDPAVSAADLTIDSPYNTYKYRGLPPGPISNPGASAIKAVVYPISNEYWYFLTTPTGQVIYSKTFTEHRQAKLRYLK